ncbi:hypothetical protein ARMGADRAFT_1029224 [Armillaria gallica]|uniref:Uncharacterized protein n=1 Tax=Armillaria gallica TaxID=47427 RepID=A0A2H3DVM9_ARMGA|nr:hypothetical protein ARMGADRAFT_1029224 [Armillaria gallica]
MIESGCGQGHLPQTVKVIYYTTTRRDSARRTQIYAGGRYTYRIVAKLILLVQYLFSMINWIARISEEQNKGYGIGNDGQQLQRPKRITDRKAKKATGVLSKHPKECIAHARWSPHSSSTKNLPRRPNAHEFYRDKGKTSEHFPTPTMMLLNDDAIKVASIKSIIKL